MTIAWPATTPEILDDLHAVATAEATRVRWVAENAVAAFDRRERPLESDQIEERERLAALVARMERLLAYLATT